MMHDGMTETLRPDGLDGRESAPAAETRTSAEAAGAAPDPAGEAPGPETAKPLPPAYLAWVVQAEALRQGDYPDFDFLTESRNPLFRRLVRSGLPVRSAYEALHLPEILDRTARDTEARIASDIRAMGARPAETGATTQAPFPVKGGVSRLTREDREDIARRAARGEIITF